MRTIKSVSIKENIYSICLLVRIFKSFFFTLRQGALFISIVILYICVMFFEGSAICMRDIIFIIFTHHCDKVPNYAISKFLKAFTF